MVATVLELVGFDLQRQLVRLKAEAEAFKERTADDIKQKAVDAGLKVALAFAGLVFIVLAVVAGADRALSLCRDEARRVRRPRRGGADLSGFGWRHVHRRGDLGKDAQAEGAFGAGTGRNFSHGDGSRCRSHSRHSDCKQCDSCSLLRQRSIGGDAECVLHGHHHEGPHGSYGCRGE